MLLVEGNAGDFNVGDELELKLDDQAKTAVIFRVMPQEKTKKLSRSSGDLSFRVGRESGLPIFLRANTRHVPLRPLSLA